MSTDFANAETSDESTLQTVTATGQPVRRRIASPAAARNIYNWYVEADRPDAIRRATLQGMIDGKPPYKNTELKEQGLAHIVNVNFGSMRANLDNRAGAANELFAEVPRLVDLEANIPDKETSRLNIGLTIAEEFSRTVLDVAEFMSSNDLTTRESDAYGFGAFMYNDQYDFIPRGVKRGSILVNPKASVNIDAHECVLVRDEMTAGELFKIAASDEFASKEGWNATAIKAILLKVFQVGDNGNSEGSYGRSTWEGLQQAHRNNDPDFQTKEFETINIVHFLTQEVSGDQRITHQIMALADLIAVPTKPGEKQGAPSQGMFLCEREEKYERMSQCLQLITSSYGDGYLRSVRGVASFMAQQDDLSNRYLGQVMDAAKLMGSIVLQPSSQIDMARMQMVQHGPYTILPPELKAQQTGFNPNLGAMIEVRNVTEQIMKNNTGLSRVHSETFSDRAGDRKTARQVVEEVSKEARLEKNQIMHRYNMMTMVYREMFRRLTRKEYLDADKEIAKEYPRWDIAQEFLDRCLARGVPRKDVIDGYKKWRLTCVRAIGMGSLGVMYDITQQLFNNRFAFDEKGQHAILRMYARTRVGNSNVDEIITEQDRDMTPSQEMSFAYVEDAALADGKQCLASGDQSHGIHIGSHARNVVLPIIQAVQQGKVQDPVKFFGALQAALKHITDHAAYWEKQPGAESKVKELQKLFQAGKAALGTLQQMIAQLQKQQQEQAQAQQERMLEMQKRMELAEVEAARAKMGADIMKEQSLAQSRDRKTASAIQSKAAKDQADISLMAERQAAELQLKALQAQADVDIKRQGAAAKTAAQ
jgi:hypothetical protein